MAAATEFIFVTVITAMQVGGLSLNCCIVFLNFKSLKNGAITNASTLIYFAMGLVNVFMQLFFMVQTFLSLFWPVWFFAAELSYTLIALNLTCMHCSFWLTGWLCAYYCTTIVNSSHQLIVVLRRVLSSFLPHIIFLTAVGSVVISVLCIWMMHMSLQMQPQSNSTLETTFSGVILVLDPAYTAIAALLGSCLPFTLAVVSTAITTVALIRHIKTMNHNVSGDNRPNSQTLINATKTMILFLTSSIIFCSFDILFLVLDKKTSFDFITMMSWFILTCFPSTEAFIIIQAIPKLRKAIRGEIVFWAKKRS